MSWLFSQALGEAYSAGTCLAGEPLSQLNVMPTPHKFWRNDKTMEFSRLSQFGLTCQLLTVDHGTELLMSYLAAFPARTSVVAGGGDGLDGERSGLWSQYRRIVRDVKPEFVYVENSPMLVSRGLDTILADLAGMGFDAEWGVVSAADTGAPHLRERIWIVGQNVANALCKRVQGIESGRADAQIRAQPQQRPDRPRGHGFGRWPAERGVGRTGDGLAYRMDRIKALGNGQVPRVAAAAWEILAP